MATGGSRRGRRSYDSVVGAASPPRSRKLTAHYCRIVTPVWVNGTALLYSLLKLSKKLFLYTALHFLLAVIFSFLAFGATGYSFKDNWEALDYIFVYASWLGSAILTFPIWIVLLLRIPLWAEYLLPLAQVLVSYSQVRAFTFLYSKMKKKREFLQNT